MPHYVNGHSRYRTASIKKWFLNTCIQSLPFNLIPTSTIRDLSHEKHLLEQWLIGVLALMDSQLLVLSKGLLATFKSALFNKSSLVWREKSKNRSQENSLKINILWRLYTCYLLPLSYHQGLSYHQP